MFDLIIRYERKKWLRDHFSDFKESFTPDQQRAVLISLLRVANADGHFHREEERLFARVAGMMGYDLEDDYIDEFFELDRKEIQEILSAMDDDHKVWYVATLFMMIHMDGKSMEVEFDIARPYLDGMGIDRRTFKSMIGRSALARKLPDDFLA